MRYEIENLPRSELEISFVVEPQELEPFLNDAVKEVSKETEIPGFRKGEAPRSIIEKKVGLLHLYEHAAQKAVKKFYVEAIMEKDIEAIGKPNVTITKMAPNNDLEFKAVVAVMPEIKLPDWEKIAKDAAEDKKLVSVAEAEIDEAIKWLQDSRATEAAVARPARIGDKLTIDFATKNDGKEIDGGSQKDYVFILGKGGFVPGFEDELSGMKSGEEKNFTLKAPENYWHKDLAGKSLDFEVKLKNVLERNMPEANDDFAKSIGRFETIQALRNNISKGLEAEKKEKERSRFRILILDKVAEKTAVEIPEVMIEREIGIMLEELKNSVESAGLPLETYLGQIKRTVDDLKKEFRPDAEKRVKFSLILRRIAKEKNIEPSREEVEIEANNYLSKFPSPAEAAKNIDIMDLLDYAKGVLRNEKTFEYLEKLNESR